MTRRALFKQAIAASATNLLSSKFAIAQRAASTLRSFGARGDGRVDDTLALSQALNSGKLIDGESQTFAVAGDIRCGSGFKGLVNARLVQTRAGGSNRRRTLEISGAKNFSLENVDVDRGGDGSEISDRTMIGRAGGIFIVDSRNFQLRGVRVRGGGIGSGLALLDCSDFTGDDVLAQDIWYRVASHPDDDAIHGIFLVRSHNFVLRRAQARNLGGSDVSSPSYAVSRGFGIAGCSDFRLIDTEVRHVGQGVDVSGSDGNRNFQVVGGLTEDCESFGFKFANSAHGGVVERATARRVGLGGFVVSGQSERGNRRQSHSVTMKNCLTEEVTGTRPGGSFGFGILSNPGIDASYPRAVVFEHCVARSVLPSSRMEFGFRNDVPVRLTEGQPNRVVDCQAKGWRKQEFYGF